MTKMAMVSNPIARSVRSVAARTLGRIGPIRHLITMWMTGLKRSPLRYDLSLVPSEDSVTRKDSGRVRGGVG